ncbi:uncharacterized protein LOC111356274 [Spodoptera litura]|uniref:Uncharacterized protein LOC111356274 n=1 Tax=Spodoptera litura TaxID=69820 RepID=A0A9J7ED69_SPOLT|nr:uncharacterized protein LOC111356274 [Spodoptera litura]
MGVNSTNKTLFLITLVLKIIGLKAAGEFSILYSPDSLRFMATDKTSESNLKEIFSAALGLSVEHSSEWKGLIVVDPFNTPEAAVEVYIDGIRSIGEHIALNTYKLSVDEYEPDTYKSVKERIKQHFTEGGNKIASVKLSNGNEFRKLLGNFIKNKKPTKEVLHHLKYNVEEDYLFINELQILRAVIQWIQDGGIVPDNQIDFFNFRIRSLHGVSDYHGPNSKETTEAKKLLGEAVQELSKAFVEAYVGSVLVTAVSTDVPHTRRSARSVSIPDLNVTQRKWSYNWSNESSDKKKNRYKFVKPAGTADYEWMSRAIVRPKTREGGGDSGTSTEVVPTTEQDTTTTGGSIGVTVDGSGSGSGDGSGIGNDTASVNATKPANGTIADDFDVDYPAVFNIFLWFGMVMTFSMLAIMYSFMDMDPGRDTIIYRMTSMKIKKDN